MQLTCDCPGCGKGFDLPWSSAGQRARCNHCSREFVIPAPFEPRPPRSSEAIPVRKGEADEKAASRPPVARTVRMEVQAPPPPPVEPQSRTTRKGEAVTPELLKGLRSGRVARPGEPAQAPAPEPVAPKPTRSARSYRPPLPPSPAPPPPPEPPSRPVWLIPAIVGGVISLIVLINIGFYVSFIGARLMKDRDGSGDAGPPDVALAAPAGAGSVAPPTPVSTPTQVAVAAENIPPVDRPGRPTGPTAEVLPDRPMSTADIVARYEPSVALIKGKKGSGTGFIARAGVVATNAHVIDAERAKDLEVRFPAAESGKQGPYPARLLYKDKDRDLALLGVATDLPPIRIAESYKFRKGEDVTVIGNPGVGGKLILENAISRGIVSSMTTIEKHSFLQLGIAINPGNSGGPVFDPKGRVIGVVTLKTTLQEGLAFAIPAQDLIAALGRAESPGGSDQVDGSDAPRR